MIFDNLIHLPNKLFYPLKKKDFEVNNIFKKYGYIHEVSKDENIDFVNNLNKKLENIDFSNIIYRSLSSNKKKYSLDYFENLDLETKNKINNFFNNKEQIYKISSMLGYKVKFRRAFLLINYFNGLNNNEGPKMFHRDADSLQDQVKVFLLLNNIDEDSGMFYFVPKNYIDENSRLPEEEDRKNMNSSDRYRNYDETVIKYANCKNYDTPIKKLNGTKGEIIYIDTGKIYHKGGYIINKSKKRLLIQAVFTPVLSLSNWNDNKRMNKFSWFFKQKLTTLRHKLRKNLKN